MYESRPWLASPSQVTVNSTSSWAHAGKTHSGASATDLSGAYLQCRDESRWNSPTTYENG